jgi:uncharacterized protein
LLAKVSNFSAYRSERQTVNEGGWQGNKEKLMSERILFEEAIKQGDLEGVKQQVVGDPDLLHTRDEQGVSPLLLSLYYGQKAVTGWLLSQAIEPLSIWEAAAVGNAERVRELLEENVSLRDEPAADGFTPLGLAAFFGRASTLLFLLEQGADPNLAADNSMQVRPIHSAAANRRPEVAQSLVEHLLAHGAAANVAQQGGWTPLHQAADHGHLGLVELLLEHGADPWACSDNGHLPVDMARAKGFDHVVALLKP